MPATARPSRLSAHSHTDPCRKRASAMDGKLQLELQDIQFEDLVDALSQLSHLQVIRQQMAEETQDLQAKCDRMEGLHAATADCLLARLATKGAALAAAEQQLRELNAANAALAADAAIQKSCFASKVHELVEANTVATVAVASSKAAQHAGAEREAHARTRLQDVGATSIALHERCIRLEEERQSEQNRWAALLYSAQETARAQSDHHSKLYSELVAAFHSLSGSGLQQGGKTRIRRSRPNTICVAKPTRKTCYL